jgi:hypothetical protein
MGIDLAYDGQGFYDLMKHIGHKIEVVPYGKDTGPTRNISIECLTCGEVLVDFDEPCYDEKGLCKECGGFTYIDDHPTEGDGKVYCVNEQCENSKKDWGSIGEPS